MFVVLKTKIIMFLFWFSLGFYFYKKFLPLNLKIKLLINKLSFIELFLVFLIILTIWQFIVNIVFDHLNSFYTINQKYFCLPSKDGSGYIVDGTIKATAKAVA